MLKIITSSLCFLLLFNSWVFARDIIAGPIFADVVRVRDGDSVEVVAHVWPGHDVRVSIRLRGIDAPELRARCGPEKIKAIAARARLVQLLGGKPIRLLKISGGKYFGRVLARVMNSKGVDVQQVLLKEKLVMPYRGGKRSSWCPGKIAQNK